MHCYITFDCPCFYDVVKLFSILIVSSAFHIFCKWSSEELRVQMHPSVSSWPVFVQIVNLPYVVVKATFLICLRFVVRNFLSLNAFLLWGLLQQHIWCSKYRHRRDLQCFPHYLKTNRLKTRSPNSKPKLSFLGLSSMEQYSQF